MTPCVAIVQLNEQPEDEAIHSLELVILEGKKLHSMRYSPSALEFDFPQMTSLAGAFWLGGHHGLGGPGRPGVRRRGPGH